MTDQREATAEELHSYRPQLPLKLIYRYLDAAISSAKITELCTPYGKIRPQLHLILTGGIGQGKSTQLYSAAEALKTVPVHAITKAHLLGSVDRQTGLFMQPLPWRARNSAIFVDDMPFPKPSSDEYESVAELLSLLENPYTQKHVGYRCNDVSLKDKDLYCKVKDNVIVYKTRFSFITTTMSPMHRKSQSIVKQALQSRCIVLPYRPTMEDLKLMARGKMRYTPKLSKRTGTQKINKRIYERAAQEAEKLAPCYYLRTIGDLCRLYAVQGKWDDEMVNTLMELRKAL